jgi:hypothetical protein
MKPETEVFVPFLVSIASMIARSKRPRHLPSTVTED